MRDSTLKVWSLKDGRCSAAPDGRRVAMFRFQPVEDSPADLSIYDLEEQRVRWSVPPGPDPTTEVAFSLQGDRVAAGSRSGRLVLYDTVDGRLLFERVAHGKAITALVFTPDGKSLATGSSDGPAKLWDVATGAQLVQFQMTRIPVAAWISSSRVSKGHPKQAAVAAISRSVRSGIEYSDSAL